MSREDTVAIVGGGIVGTCAAYFLACDPAFRGRVVVLERDPGYARSATCLSAASIRQQFGTAVNVRLSQFGMEFLRAAAERLAIGGTVPDVGLVDRTYLYLATAAGAAGLQRSCALQRSLDVDVELATPATLADRFPWLALDDIACGAWTRTGEGWFDAAALLHAVKAKAIALGVTYSRADVARLPGAHGTADAVMLADGSGIRVRACICAAGTRAPALLEPLGVALPVRPRKRSVYWFESPAQIERAPLLVDPSGFWTRPEGSGWLAGVTPEPDPDVDPDDFAADGTDFERDLWPRLAARIPAFESTRVRRSWVGHYDWNAFDRNALLGLVPGSAPVAFACGFSGHGLQHGPGLGRALAELVVHGAYATLDLSALRWERVRENAPLPETHVI